MIMKINELPTGYLFTDIYDKGELETLSIGDYGKKHNIKADFLGFTDEINGVPNMKCMPLSEKWVMTLSTQYGCAMKCKFCDCPKIPFNGNASLRDLKSQFTQARWMFPGVKYTERLNVHFARMGEPLFNFNNVYDFAEELHTDKLAIQQDLNLRVEVIHPVLTSCVPNAIGFARTLDRLERWTHLKNYTYNGQAGLQLSINSTNDAQRNEMFNNGVYDLETLSNICGFLPEPIGRKYCLNFAYCEDFEVDAKRLRELFNPDYFMVKITPIHNNTACRENGIETVGGYDSYAPYRKVEKDLIDFGFDVLVFVPSMDEEDGLVTCGNLVLSGTELRV